MKLGLWCLIGKKLAVFFLEAADEAKAYNYMAPKKYLFFRGDRVCCNDYTDATLAIEKGDQLSVIIETSGGYIVKKDGVLGWYKV